MFGAACSPCCQQQQSCGVNDGKERTDPKNEGTWVPSGTWLGTGGVTWTFQANPGNESGNTWFFFGSSATSKEGTTASVAERQDWGNLCNWYSSKSTSPSAGSASSTLTKRATRLPPEDAIVHIYSFVSAVSVGGATVANAYFWANSHISGSIISTTSAAHDSSFGAVFNAQSLNEGTVNNGATFNNISRNQGTVNDGATFNGAVNINTANGGATFNGGNNYGTVNGGAVFNAQSFNEGTVYNGATFNNTSRNTGSGTVNGGATFNASSWNDTGGTVNGNATFNGNSQNYRATVNGDATFNGSSQNNFGANVNGNATFNGTSQNVSAGVTGDATFNDSACCQNAYIINFQSFFTPNPYKLPTCNGSAPTYANRGNSFCGCR